MVTGAGSGIGRAIALALAARGMHLVLVGRTAPGIEDTARAIGAAASAVIADLATEHGLRQAAAACPALLRVLVHSAGVHFAGPVLSATARDWEALMATNLRAPMLLTAACRPALAAARGDVVMINSTAGLHAGAGNGAYAASKQALRCATDTLRQELAPEAVRVLSLYPGRTDTRMQSELLAAEGRTAPPGALLAPETVADLVLAALSLPAGAEVPDLVIRPSRKL